ncbi:FecR family protein [Gaoshiqia sediminis]|uniref:DUF4974 domain-containing protein n=1 Tax=Gaoshiqia sediminis TaxID=2986998 RepID=A0AA41Y4U3_9BACT|nr:FecR domain-containing protein [Gaoshiqia sediminis]MCW0481860.1 DUF4974 domain-containing protein [Gaoshiqia sediminis]
MNSTINKEQLVRFINRETSLSEDHQIFRWIAESEGNREELRQLYETDRLSRQKNLSAQINVEDSWSEFSAKRLNVSRKTSKPLLNYWTRIAASVLILVSVSVGSIEGYRLFTDSNNTKTLVQLHVPSGEKSIMILADGTKVWLNSESSITYNPLEPRSVNLTGEAYFEVSEDKSHPFIVHTELGLNVRVLGTEFNLRCYPDEAIVETTLDKGRIELFGKNIERPVEILPGQQAVLSENSLNIKNVNAQLFSVWRNNELKIQDSSFGELVPLIERWYGVSIHLDARLRDQGQFTMTIKTESIRELFMMMQLTSNFQYEINGSEIRLKAK